MSEWVIRNKFENKANNLAETILQGRGYSDQQIDDFIAPDYHGGLADPFLMSDMAVAVDRLLSARQKKEQVIIYGDYDIDGITAATVLHKTFSRIGLKSKIYIPDRFEEGYGLNEKALLKLRDEGADLVVTVDCGVTASVEVTTASKAGLPVIITDHHNLAKNIPPAAVAVLNPKRPDSKYPETELAGVGVAFTLVRALQIKLPELIPAGHEKWLLDLVALGTVCDVVPLIGENRLLTKFGLMVMAKSRNIGLAALAKVAGIELKNITSQDLGFRLGPRLNAAGRIEHASLAIDLLNSNDQTEAQQLADKLNILNTQRRDQTDDIVREASLLAKKNQSDKILLLADPDWSHGVVGIAAARISEKFNKPTILLQIEGNQAKGSARSVGELSIIEALNAAREYLIKYGGHDFAAGVTTKTKNINKLRNALNKYADNNDLTHKAKLEIDLDLPNEMINLDSYSELDKLNPFGRENRQPLLLSNLVLKSAAPIGKDFSHLKFTFIAGQNEIDGVAFGRNDKWPWLTDAIGQKLAVVYRIMKNEWRNTISAQIEVLDMRENQ